MAPSGAINANAQREVQTLKHGWEFSYDDEFDASNFPKVRILHDWAIYGSFDRKHDLQIVAVEQNSETVATPKTGRTGGFPFIGKGIYRTCI